jgi:hypothetical protein
MKHFIKITDWYWVPGSSKEMIYVDDKGKKFIGPPSEVIVGETIIVEGSEFLEDGCRRIIRFVGRLKG